jgi:hypothetical protein
MVNVTQAPEEQAEGNRREVQGKNNFLFICICVCIFTCVFFHTKARGAGWIFRVSTMRMYECMYVCMHLCALHAAAASHGYVHSHKDEAWHWLTKPDLTCALYTVSTNQLEWPWEGQTPLVSDTCLSECMHNIINNNNNHAPIKIDMNRDMFMHIIMHRHKKEWSCTYCNQIPIMTATGSLASPWQCHPHFSKRPSPGFQVLSWLIFLMFLSARSYTHTHILIHIMHTYQACLHPKGARALSW